MKAIIDYQSLVNLRSAAAAARGCLHALNSLRELQTVTTVIEELENALENARDYEMEPS